jgi:hypothetical protein
VLHAAALRAILFNDPLRWQALDLVRTLQRPDCWIGAGFVRNAVWDHLHGRPPGPPPNDVDVLWFDPARTEPSEDTTLETTLRSLQPKLAWPDLAWSVKNQARMHIRNHDPPYASSADAMRCWPETATAVAVHRTGPRHCDIAAPFGLDDLFALILRPTPSFAGDKHAAYLQRVRTKGWLAAWPRLRMQPAHDSP